MMDVSTHCSRDLMTTSENLIDLTLMDIDQKDCENHLNRTSTWTRSSCRSSIPKESILQIKTDQEYIYIYCYKHSISIQGQPEMPCENMVYRLSLAHYFSIDGKNYTTHQVLFASNYTWQLDVTKLLNNRMFITPLNTNLLEAMKTIVDREEVEDQQLPWERVVIHHYTITTFVLIIIVIILIYLLCKCFKRRSLMAYMEDWRARSRNQPEMREMQARA